MKLPKKARTDGIRNMTREQFSDYVFTITALLYPISVIILIILIIFAHSGPAIGSAVCLTKKEARQLWPKRHIYWYSSNHCWSNRRGGKPTGVKYDLIRENHAESLPAKSEDAGKADRATSPPKHLPGTVRTIPIVKQTEWKNDFEDYCCWPMLESIDPDGERERAFRLLAEKMRKPVEQKK